MRGRPPDLSRIPPARLRSEVDRSWSGSIPFRRQPSHRLPSGNGVKDVERSDRRGRASRRERGAGVMSVGSNVEHVLQSRTVSNTGTLGSIETVSKVSPSAIQPEVHTAAAGNSTVFWVDERGVWTSDKPLGAPWSRPELILPGMNLAYRSAENLKGEAAVVGWKPTGQDLHPGSFLTAVVRAAGSNWSKPRSVASVPGYFLLADDIAVSNNGDAVIAWEKYHATCTQYRHRCFESDAYLHGSRLKQGTAEWQNSGTLLGPFAGLIGATVTMDDRGDAGLVTFGYFTVLAQSFTQSPYSLVWHGPVAIPQSRQLTISAR